MYLRRKVFSSYIDENEEEKTTGDKIKKAGKIGLGAGVGLGLTAGAVQVNIANDALKKAAKKYGLEKQGLGLVGVGKKSAQEAAEITGRALRQNKAFRHARLVDKLGIGGVVLGTGGLIAGHIMNKRAKNKKDSEF